MLGVTSKGKSSMAVESHQIYQSMMLEIKVRIRAIDSKIEGSEKYISPLDTEFCFLQIRKIVEQICFSSILCDQERYKDFRKLEGETNDDDSGKFEDDWNSRVILSKLKDISPHFMPIPLGERSSNGNEHHFERANVNATHTRLIKIFKKCGSFMHMPRPFGEEYELHINKQRNHYNQATETIKTYCQYFKDLLWHHAAIGLEYTSSVDGLETLNAANPQTAWLVNFEEYESDHISIVLAHAN
jgi:hypothetical protein